MYWNDVYFSFVQLRKQIYKIKKRKNLDRYTKIENYKSHYRTFKKFCNDVEEYFWRRYSNEPTEETIQEVFENCLDMSQRKILKKVLIP